MTRRTLYTVFPYFIINTLVWGGGGAGGEGLSNNDVFCCKVCKSISDILKFISNEEMHFWNYKMKH